VSSDLRLARHLEQILTNIDLVRDYTRGMTKQAFIADPKTRDAVERCLQRITEAARRIGDRLDEAHPNLELHKLRQFGSILRHDYDAIDPDLVWAAVTRRLDDLEAACRRELDARRRP
jgi:uncharacterized protein with HEPN domain